MILNSCALAFRFRRCLLLSITGLLASSVLLHAADQLRFPTSEDLRHVKAMAGPLLSPDGNSVLFIMTEATADGARSHLWLVPVNGGEARQLTYSPAVDKRGEHDAAWAPDNSAIFFLARRGENTQLFRLPMAGGEAAPYELKTTPAVDDSTEPGFLPPAKADAKKDDAKPEPIAIDVNGFAISPDGHWLAVIARDPETAGEKKGKEAKADAVWVNHERHGERLYLAALKSGAVIDGALRQVPMAPDVNSISWSPKSDRMLVLTEPPNQASDLAPAAATWIVNTSALDQPVALKAVPPTVRGGFGWSEDGNQVVFAAQTPEDAPPGVEELFVLSLASETGPAPAQPRRLLADCHGGVGNGELVFLPGDKVLAPVAIGTKLGAARVALDGQAAADVLPQSESIVANLGTNRRQTGWVWLTSGSAHPETLCFSASLGGDCRQLPVPELTTQHFLGVQSTLVTWKSDGLTIEGLLYLPPQASTQKVPLVVDIHGGPLGAWLDRYQEWTGFLAGHGWAILRPNPRGSSAYGVRFAAANKNDLGGGDYRDIMAGVDAVLKQYPIDPNKLALMGYSYGGEMAAFVEGRTDRFKAIISGAPVIDQFSEYGTEGESWYDRWYFGKPWERMEDAWRQSPLAGAARARTPFLLLQGEADKTDPLGQSQEMYRALRQAGAPVEMVEYPREDHGPLARGIFGSPVSEPWHGFDGRQRIVEFLEKGFGETPKP